MATTASAFEVELNSGGFPGPRGIMGGACLRLRDAYGRGITDPTAHALAKVEQRDVEVLTVNGKLASFDAITAP